MTRNEKEFSDVDDFVFSPYNAIPWDNSEGVSIKGIYESSRVPSWAVFSRFQRLDNEGKKLAWGLKYQAEVSEKFSSGFQNLLRDANNLVAFRVSFEITFFIPGSGFSIIFIFAFSPLFTIPIDTSGSWAPRFRFPDSSPIVSFDN